MVILLPSYLMPHQRKRSKSWINFQERKLYRTHSGPTQRLVFLLQSYLMPQQFKVSKNWINLQPKLYLIPCGHMQRLVDGPTHFVGQKPTGSTVLKRRQLENIGKIPLLSLPYTKWGKLNIRKQKQNFLEAKIKKVLCEIP